MDEATPIRLGGENEQISPSHSLFEDFVKMNGEVEKGE
jgi:hypothetical protein